MVKTMGNEIISNDEVLKIASLTGKMLLASGGEVYRTEMTVAYICKAYGIDYCECSATPTEITVSIYDNNGECKTFMRRINRRNLDLHKVEELNQFSRDLCGAPLSAREAMDRLDKIDNEKSYSLPVLMLITGIGTSAFAVVFGGSLWDVILGFVVGVLLRFFIWVMSKMQLPDAFGYLASGGIAALLSWLAIRISLGDHSEIIMISALTFLFPGLVFTNSLRDMAEGDLLSGISRAVEALTIAAALAGGAALAYIALQQMGGEIL